MSKPIRNLIFVLVSIHGDYTPQLVADTAAFVNSNPRKKDENDDDYIARLEKMKTTAAPVVPATKPPIVPVAPEAKSPTEVVEK